MKNIDYSLYLVTDRSLLYRNLGLGTPLEEIVEGAVKGGVTVVQLREKDCPSKDFYHIALRLKDCLKTYNVPLIINDRIDIAIAADADGVHIGQNDIPYPVARQLLGKDKIIGLTVENIEQVKEANDLDVEYIGISPVFSTPTKIDTAPPFKIEGLREAVQFSKHPVVGIGGINENNIAEVMGTGVDGVAVVSAIISSKDPEIAARSLKQKISNI